MRNSLNYVHAKFRFIPNILPISVNQVGGKKPFLTILRLYCYQNQCHYLCCFVILFAPRVSMVDDLMEPVTSPDYEGGEESS